MGIGIPPGFMSASQDGVGRAIGLFYANMVQVLEVKHDKLERRLNRSDAKDDTNDFDPDCSHLSGLRR